MFYSQFILAKKGPLGTIWIAAHLERKLRKNQVADTDIGVSVDSILFPEVPIALRLSSHLLLGVVRIYSRKVNYLFDDCSEALLNIKQAFRSTAVDLPPDESKAPYHSITLPETFDLDDFELPDNEIFQGNYVDHHISAREQITLQDNMEGVVYSTSQFGLDERFGDGDTAGLDLEEELFLQKVDAAGLAGISADTGASIQPTMPVKQDEVDEGSLANREPRIEAATEDVDVMDYTQAPSTPGLVAEPNLANVQETSACDDHITCKYNNLMESSVKQNLQNISGKSNLSGKAHLAEWSFLPENTNSGFVHIPCEETVYHSGHGGLRQVESPSVVVEQASLDDPNSVCVTSSGITEEIPLECPQPDLTSQTLATSDRLDNLEKLQNEILEVDGTSDDLSHVDHRDLKGFSSKESGENASNFASCGQQIPEGTGSNHQRLDSAEKCKNVEVLGNLEGPFSVGCVVDKNTKLVDASSLEKAENQESTDSHTLGEMQHSDDHVLRPCNAGLRHLNPSHTGGDYPNNLDMPSNDDVLPDDISEAGKINHTSGLGTLVQGVQHVKVDESKHVLEDNHVTEPVLREDVHVGCGKSDDQVNNGFGTESPNHKDSANLEFPAPEKLLSVPEGLGDQAMNLLVEATPGELTRVDESDAGSRIMSGKKRSYTESTLTEQSLNSFESSRIVHHKKTVEAIPDDDDLLSSILVGRKSSLLKMKPSPPPCEMTSLKRHRSAPRPSASKRRVLMDDTMVLHGDTIRQQLTSTEDIRRLRKKAPCTLPEISMILKQFLEDDIFGEPICSGVSTQLASLHNQTYDLSGIIVSQDDVNVSVLLSGTDVNGTFGNDENISNFGNENAVGSHVTAEKDMEGIGVIAVHRVNYDVQACETDVLVEDKKDGNNECSAGVDIGQVQIRPTEEGPEGAELSGSPLVNSQNLVEKEVGGNSFIVQTVNPAIPVEMEPPDHTPGDAVGEIVGIVQITSLDESLMDEPVIPSEKIEIENVEVDGLVMGRNSSQVDNEKDDIVNGDDVVSAVVETAMNKSNLGVESSACSLPVDRETDLRRVEYNDQLFDGIYGEQDIIGASHPAESANVQDSFFYEGEYQMQREAYSTSVVDTEFCGEDMHNYDDLNYSAAAYETEFLNFDDDEVDEVIDDHTPNAEEIRFTENSGWSSRTRAVAKYLQTLFTKETENGRKALQMDNLLTGKTRKEASRMFFEALVLKTRDYIHVEQEHPFDIITIKPRMKLTKSDF